MIGFFDSSRQPLILEEEILKEALWEKLNDIVAAKGKEAPFPNLLRALGPSPTPRRRKRRRRGGKEGDARRLR